MFSRKINWPRTLMLIGALIWLFGEIKGANNTEKGDTTSEWFGALPDWVKHLISWGIGATCAHLWKWTYGHNTTVNVEGDANVEVNEESK